MTSILMMYLLSFLLYKVDTIACVVSVLHARKNVANLRIPNSFYCLFTVNIRENLHHIINL